MDKKSLILSDGSGNHDKLRGCSYNLFWRVVKNES